MKISKLMKICIILVICFAMQSVLLIQISNAVIETNRIDYPSSKNLNYALEQCWQMRNGTSSLGTNNLDPHLATARDMGAAVFLGLSGYGAVTTHEWADYPQIGMTYETTNPTLDSNGVYVPTTTGNMTGVIKIGTSTELVALVDKYSQSHSNEGNTDYAFQSKYNRYVDIATDCTDEATRGMPLTELAYNNGHYWYSSDLPNSLTRNESYCWYYISNMSGSMGSYYWPDTTYCYRPCIWNNN